MSDRQERPPKDRVQVNPEPVRPELFSFIERLFDGSDQKPERIELKQAFGASASKYGQQIDLWEFKPNVVKPEREAIVALSNKIVDLAQQNCNAIGKRHRYAVLAKHYAKSDSYYAAFVLAMNPKQIAPDKYDPTAEDDDELTSDSKHRDNLLHYILDHNKHADEHERFRQEQSSAATGDIIGSYQQLVQMLSTQNLELMREHRELFKQTDDALSHKAERDNQIEMRKFKLGMMTDAFNYLKALTPVVVKQIQGKQPGPGERSAESMAFEAFLEGLTENQAKALFGEYDEAQQPDGTIKRTLRGNGIFTPEQAMIFSGVARCERPLSDIDLLMDGEHAITEMQRNRAMSIISMQQFGPLLAVVHQKMMARGLQQNSPTH